MRSLYVEYIEQFQPIYAYNAYNGYAYKEEYNNNPGSSTILRLSFFPFSFLVIECVSAGYDVFCKVLVKVLGLLLLG